MTDKAASTGASPTGAIPRTEAEIVARIKARGGPGVDIFGVERSRLLDALPPEAAQQFYRDGSTAGPRKLDTREQCAAEVKSYLEFAWGKANGCRGLSSARSIAHFVGLVWLLGVEFDDLLAELTSSTDYRYYGKPQLVKVSERFGVDWRKLDNDQWVNAEGDEPLTAADALQQ